uniref:Uncharacterized protein n=1 Tax=Calcidiscus leptoporus TaxID=127549 RepID=A0A7S0IU88_9EUKA|mmetsp:Transcript_22140/g.50886  ORF Transcript_22140/g.50886 Transcript_22140/m.50886 type:complete len:141 (+) Transcript_22140:377-799(+)
MRHTHFGWDGRIDGVRYVQAALATPHERARRPASLAVGDFYPGTGSLAPICVFEASRGLPAPWRAAWSDHYARAPRAPSDTRPAPWVVEHWRRRAPARVSGTGGEDDPGEGDSGPWTGLGATRARTSTSAQVLTPRRRRS